MFCKESQLSVWPLIAPSLLCIKCGFVVLGGEDFLDIAFGYFGLGVSGASRLPGNIFASAVSCPARSSLLEV